MIVVVITHTVIIICIVITRIVITRTVITHTVIIICIVITHCYNSCTAAMLSLTWRSHADSYRGYSLPTPRPSLIRNGSCHLVSTEYSSRSVLLHSSIFFIAARTTPLPCTMKPLFLPHIEMYLSPIETPLPHIETPLSPIETPLSPIETRLPWI